MIKADIRPAIRADHNAISLRVRIKENKTGPGCWKMNTSILSDEKYLNSVRNIGFLSHFRKLLIRFDTKFIQIREIKLPACKFH